MQDIVEVFERHKGEIDTTAGNWAISDKVLERLRPDLEAIGFHVERGKRKAEKLHRPVFFGEQGVPSMTYEIDAYHDEHGILLEVEAGRATQGNAIYRDLIQMSLMVEGRFAAIALPLDYRFGSGEKKTLAHPYRLSKNLLDAVWNSSRLELPFEGMVLIGY